MKKLLIVLSIIILSGCFLVSGNYEHKAESFTFEYSTNYYIDQSSDPDKLTVIKKEDSKYGELRIYNTNNFDPDSILIGYSSSGLEEFEAISVPKEKIKKDHLEIWLFYHSDFLETKDELYEIIETITIKK